MAWKNLSDESKEEKVKPKEGEVKPTEKPKAEVKWDFSEAKTQAIPVFTIYGEKGDGKTVLALSFPGKIAAISFDRKTQIIKNNFYDGDERIKVFDAVRYLDEMVENYPKSSHDTIEYCKQLLTTKIKELEPDYILIDGTEILMRIAEQAMRHKFGWSATEGIKNMNAWKIRRLILRGLHARAVQCAKKGVIYTTYMKQKEIIHEGTLITKKDIPAYVDILLWETDIVLKSWSEYDKKTGKKFLMRIDSSKLKQFGTGKEYDVTNKRILDIIKPKEVKT